MNKVSVLGAGAWGTALAKLLADKGYPVSLWSHSPELAARIEEARENVRYLPGALLPETLTATADVERALSSSDLVVVAVPSHALRGVVRAARTRFPREALVCSATKGIENDSLMLMSEVLLDELGAASTARLTYLSGPSFAREVALRMPTAVVVAGHHEGAAHAVQQAFATPHFRVYSSTDVVGVEVGGALKNVIAIAAGALDGLGLGHNSRAGMVTRGLAEIARLAMKKGGSALTVAGLSGLGDLVLTCTGELSRNRKVGYELGRGLRLPEILASLGHVAEGVKTAKSARDLGKRLEVEMPITNEVYAVLYEGKSAAQAVSDIMGRPLREE